MFDDKTRRAERPHPSPEPLPVLGRLRIGRCPDASEVGRTFPIRGEQTAIGRATTNTIVIRDPDMSGYHARILARGGELILIDTLSTNGTWVNGVRITEHRLRIGDTFLLGSTAFSFCSP
jgi:pSer/pThr/pTyr-binding forkhead associated (FHA) protein